MKIKIILILVFINILYSKTIENKQFNIKLEFSENIYSDKEKKLWEKVIITNNNTGKKIILSDGTPIFSNDFKFSPDGSFLKYQIYLAPINKEGLRNAFIDCLVIDLVKNRSFFDEPLLSRCRSEWFEKEEHTLVNVHDIEYDNKGNAFFKYFYRLPKESFLYDYFKIEKDFKNNNYQYLKERFTVQIIKKIFRIFSFNKK